MAEHDRDETFDWVARAYAATPPAANAARERAVMAARAAVAAETVTPIRRQSRPRPWMPAVTLLAAACLLVAWWHVLRHSERGQLHTAIAKAPITSTISPASPAAPANTASPIVPENTVTSGNLASAPLTSPSPVASPTPKPLPGEPVSIPPVPPAVATQPAAVTPPASSPLPTPTPVDGLDPESAALVTRILDSAAAQGLPTAALVARVREGVRRHVPGPRIVVVTRNYAAALANARSALGHTATPSELQSGAEALIAGAPMSALQQMRTKRQSAPPGVDHSLPSRGVSPTLPRDSASIP
jgi:hypothetical protein